MKSYLEFKKEELERLYIDEKMTQRQIAQKFHCEPRTVRKAMRAFGIPARLQKKPLVERNCPQCGKVTTNPKYCSSSCAAIFNNKHFPKRSGKKRRWICVMCGKPAKDWRKYCEECKPNSYKALWKTIGELRRDGYLQMYRTVRSVARRVYRESGQPWHYAVCGYSTHVEIAHRKAISSFDKTALVSEVNRLENLIALCPNHHWEFDRGLINL